MRTLITILFLSCANALIAQPTSVILNLPSDAQNIIWFEYNDATQMFDIITGETDTALQVTEPGLFFAQYIESGKSQTSIPAFVTCAIGDSTLEMITLNASSTDPSSSYQWTIDGTPIPNSDTPSIQISQVGLCQVIVSKPGCPLDTVSFRIIGLDCCDSLQLMVTGIQCQQGAEDLYTVTFEYLGDSIWTNFGEIRPDEHRIIDIPPGVELIVSVMGGSECPLIIDTAIAMPRSINCLAHLRVSCGALITLRDVVAGPIGSNDSIYALRIEDEFGREVSNPLPLGFTGKLWAKVTNSCTGSSCETEIVVGDKPTCHIVNTLDTTIWCIDDFIAADILSDYYKDTLGLRPVAVDGCGSDTLGYAQYGGEWEEVMACGDTLSKIVRAWYWENKDGSRCYGYDTLTLVRLPMLSDILIAPQKDTVSCTLDTVYDSTEIYSEVCWKQLVALHSEGVMIYYPVADAMSGTGDEVVLIRTNGDEESLNTIAANYATVLHAGKNSYEVEIFAGDKVLSAGGVFVTVDEDWFYEAGEYGVWIDICVPSVRYEIDTLVRDVWPSACVGAEVVLPNHPYKPDTCAVFCLSELASFNSCVEVVTVEEKELSGGSCPVVRKRSTSIKQLCFAKGVATLSSATSGCAADTNTSGVTRVDSMGGSLFVEIDQWLIYEDTIAPIARGESRSYTYSSDANSCSGNVEIPGIEVKDACSGVKSVRATLTFRGQEIGLGWVELTDDDGDGKWSQAQGGRRLRMACGDEFEVRYALMDSCHNAVMIDRHILRMEDRTAPTVITDDTLRLSLGGYLVGIEAANLLERSSDNCGIAQILVRRADTMMCGGAEDRVAHAPGDVCYEALDSFEILGGGWSENVNFCCADVCDNVVVEVLVIDKSCNYTKGWVVVYVEDNSRVEKAKDFDTLSLGCSSYADHYGDVIEMAASDDQNAHHALDDLLGGLLLGKRGENDRLVNDMGEEIPMTFGYATSRCSTEVTERRVLDTAHNGELVWEVLEVEHNVLYESEERAEVGGVYVRCGSRVEREVSIDLDDCGQGKVIRRWLVYGSCSDRSLSVAEMNGTRGNENTDERPLILEQVIDVVSDCPLSEASLKIPNDTSICSDLMYDMTGNLSLEVDELMYDMEDIDCRAVGIGYRDDILRIVGDADRRTVLRTWAVNDWCSGESLEYVQRIVVDMNCAQSLSGAEMNEEETSRANDNTETSFQLYQNRPNPFMDRSVIRFRLPEATKAKLTFFDGSGRVLYAIEKYFDAGVHEETIHSSELGSRIGAVVYYQLDTDTHTDTKQMIILK